jgi:NADH-quinone oxidoreductase subunit M
VIWGAVKNERVSSLRDLCKRESILLGAMAVLVLAIGMHPKTFTDAIGPSVEGMLSAAQGSSLPDDNRAPAYDARHEAVSTTRLPG